MTDIHETAIVKTEKIGSNVTIGPFCYISETVDIGNNVHIFGHVILGTAAQWKDHPEIEEARVVIGDNVTIREFVTINSSVIRGTIIEDDVLIFAKAHVAHDSIIHQGAIIGSLAHLGGLCSVGAYSVLGASSVIHQKFDLPAYSMLGSNALFKSDCKTEGLIWVGSVAFPVKVNSKGLEKHITDEEILKKKEKEAKAVLFNYSSMKKMFKRDE